ncbi:12284_t:CDS:2 [Entrophospora sp. SA101]|nr:14464_t:CDS:2 [Entrophospora sp. SA101]CAJ0847155.1 12284_t:CDS:2 [Entrophospora sp. SA101]
MRLLQIINKLWSKITETKWAILYVRFAAVRLVVAIAMNAVILKLHEDIAEKLLNLHDIENDLPDDRKYAYINYDYEIYRIITVGMINLMLILFSGINLARSLKWIGRINNQLEIDRPFIDDDTVDTTDISRAVITWEIIHLLILTGFAASSLFFGYKLYQHFGWNIYKKIGANIQMQAMYRTYLVFLLLIKLDTFLLLGFQILTLSFLFSENVEGNTRTIILQCIMVAIVIPTIGLALWGVIMISNLIFILASVIIKREEVLLLLLDILGILLIVLSMIVAYLTARNFGFGLEDHFQKKHQIVTVDLESSGVQQPTRFSIDG